jgi:hypothetical protein
LDGPGVDRESGENILTRDPDGSGTQETPSLFLELGDPGVDRESGENALVGSGDPEVPLLKVK